MVFRLQAKGKSASKRLKSANNMSFYFTVYQRKAITVIKRARK